MIGAYDQREQTILTARALGAKARKKRAPGRPIPTAMLVQFERDLGGMVEERAAPAFEQLFKELPGIVASARASRGDSARRLDVGEGKRVRQIVAAAYKQMMERVSSHEIEAIAIKHARRIADFGSDILTRQAKAALGVEIAVVAPTMPVMLEHFTTEVVAHTLAVFELLAMDVEKTITRAISTGRVDAVDVPIGRAPEVLRLARERGRDHDHPVDRADDSLNTRTLGADPLGNAQLIRNITPGSAFEIAGVVAKANEAGDLTRTLQKRLREQFGFAKNRARLIARDQLGKLNGQITAARHRELGITRFYWRTVHDERVRSEHRDRDGKIYSYTSPPKGELPGEPIQCRCYADPVFDELVDDITGPAPTVEPELPYGPDYEPPPAPRAPKADPVTPPSDTRNANLIRMPRGTRVTYQGREYVVFSGVRNVAGTIRIYPVGQSAAEAIQVPRSEVRPVQEVSGPARPRRRAPAGEPRPLSASATRPRVRGAVVPAPPPLITMETFNYRGQTREIFSTRFGLADNRGRELGYGAIVEPSNGGWAVRPSRRREVSAGYQTMESMGAERPGMDRVFSTREEAVAQAKRYIEEAHAAAHAQAARGGRNAPRPVQAPTSPATPATPAPTPIAPAADPMQQRIQLAGRARRIVEASGSLGVTTHSVAAQLGVSTAEARTALRESGCLLVDVPGEGSTWFVPTMIPARFVPNIVPNQVGAGAATAPTPPAPPTPVPSWKQKPPPTPQEVEAARIKYEQDIVDARAAIERTKKEPYRTTLHPAVTDPDNQLKYRAQFERTIQDITGNPNLTLAEITHGFAVPEGYEARLMSVSGYGDEAHVQWKIVDKKTGKTAASNLSRKFKRDSQGRPYVYHDYFLVEDDYQGTGISNVVNGNAMRHYEKWGLKSIKVTAAWVGRYAWARMGFKFEDSGEAIRSIESYLRRNPLTKDRLAELMPIARVLVKEPHKLAKWDLEGLEFEDEEPKNRKGGRIPEKVPLGKALLLSREMDMYSAKIPIDPNDSGYRHATVITDVVPKPPKKKKGT